MKKLNYNIHCLLFFMLTFFYASSQCPGDQPPTSLANGFTENIQWGGSDSRGQSFTSCKDGIITSISLRIPDANAYSGDINLYLGEEPGASMKLEGNLPVYNTFSVIDIPGVQDIVIDLSTNPFTVAENTKYRMEFQRVGVIGNFAIETKSDGANGGTYSGGDYVDQNGNYVTFRDFNFSMIIDDPLPIPTLSQWGIIALGMLSMIFGVVMIRQRKVIFG